MSVLGLQIGYRPVRIGWCVRYGNLEDVRRGLRLTHTLWGGRYNPIIPISTNVDAASLVRNYNVDALYPLADSPEVTAFAGSLPHLRWPGDYYSPEFFIRSETESQPPFVDISHSFALLDEREITAEPNQKITPTIFSWEVADPLADVFLAQFGSFPSGEEIGRDYEQLVIETAGGTKTRLGLGDPLPVDAFRTLTPSVITSIDLHSSRAQGAGFYVGKAHSFEDIVNFWNLRAANLDILFFDERYAQRMSGLRDAFLSVIQTLTRGTTMHHRSIEIWSNDNLSPVDMGPFGNYRAERPIHSCIPIGLRSPLMQSRNRSVLANVSDLRGKPLVSVQLPDNPFRDRDEFPSPMMVVVIKPGVDFEADPDHTLMTPYLPEMNEFYRREMVMIGYDVRVQSNGFGVIVPVHTSEIYFCKLQTSKVIAGLFDVFGIGAQPSLAGQIAKRIIHQMGGLQGCRVFKLPGVRNLIGKHSPFKSFTRGSATALIAALDPLTNKPQIPELYVEQRKVTPNVAFDYLLKKGAFRSGLDLDCPNCNLEFWLPLESLGHEVRCEYCGKTFNVTPQLKDRDWRYRRSGLFGRDNHQEGALPVVVTLQQLETNVGPILGSRLLATSFKLASAGAPIGPCESDVVAVMQDSRGDVQLVIGECKSGGSKTEITADDVNKLMAIAKCFPPERITVYILFSKTGAFSSDEISRCMVAQEGYRPRVILLSDRELEPYHVYERTAKEFDVSPTVISLDHLARATPHIFFEPKRRPQAPTPTETSGSGTD